MAFIKGGEIGGQGARAPPPSTLETDGAEPPHIMTCPYSNVIVTYSFVIIIVSI